MAHTRLLGRVALGSLAIALTLAAAGCGNQHTGPGYANGSSGGLTYAHEALGKDDLMPAAYRAATKAGTVHFTLSVTRKTRKGTTCSCLSGTGDAIYGTAKPTMSMDMTQQGHRIVMRMVGGMFYLQVPGITPRGRFIAVDPRDKRSPFARGFAASGDTMDPGASLKNLASAVQTAERVGKQTMDGVTVEHYQVKIATASLLHKGGYAANAGGMPDSIDYGMWLDEKHLIHRIAYQVAGVTFEETLSRWGEPVHIQKPAARQLMYVPGV